MCCTNGLCESFENRNASCNRSWRFRRICRYHIKSRSRRLGDNIVATRKNSSQSIVQVAPTAVLSFNVKNTIFCCLRDNQRILYSSSFIRNNGFRNILFACVKIYICVYYDTHVHDITTTVAVRDNEAKRVFFPYITTRKRNYFSIHLRIRLRSSVYVRRVCGFRRLPSDSNFNNNLSDRILNYSKKYNFVFRVQFNC